MIVESVILLIKKLEEKSPKSVPAPGRYEIRNVNMKIQIQIWIYGNILRKKDLYEGKNES